MDPQPDAPQDDVDVTPSRDAEDGDVTPSRDAEDGEPEAAPRADDESDALEGGAGDSTSASDADSTAMEPDGAGPTETLTAEPGGEPEPDAIDPADTLSPAVRRLIRQYDLDITGIHGTGPSGRIRVGDVMNMLGGQAEPTAGRAASGEPNAEAEDGEQSDPPDRPDASRDAAAEPMRDVAAEVPASTLFECDLGRVLSHRKREKARGHERLLTSYYLLACADALEVVPEVCRGAPGARVLGIALASTTGDTHYVTVEAPNPAGDGSIEDRLADVDRKLRAGGDAGEAGIWIHHYGPSGSLLVTPTPIAPGVSASVGIGAVRRQIGVRVTNGEETPRVAAVCYLGLSFYPSRLTLDRANRFLAEVVRVLEQWPLPAT